MPLPILWVVDYFVIDGEGFRFGRFYRTAGWYAHIAAWTAFPCWLLSLILFKSVISYGAYFLALTGILQIVAVVVWSVVRNPNPLHIPFEDGDIVTHFGPSYWLTLVIGILCLILSVAILICEHFYNEATYLFFGVDPLTNYETAYLSRYCYIENTNIIPIISNS